MNPRNHRPPLQWGMMILLLVSGILHAQTVRWQGTVREQGTGEPVVAAQVRIVGRAIGTLTDAEGRFSLSVEGAASALEVTHIGYQRHVVQLADREGKVLDIRMEVAGGIAPVLITAGPSRVFEDRTVHLYDYDLIDNRIVAIIYDRQLRRSKLVLLDDRDSIVDTELLPEEPGRLEKDCLGSVHALSRNYAFQLFLDRDEIAFYVDSLRNYMRVVPPCLGNIGGHYYYVDSTMDDQILDFKTFDVETKTWKQFLHLADKDRIHQLMDPLDRYAGIAHSPIAMIPNISGFWEQVHKTDYESQFAKLAFFRPVEAQLRVIGDHVFVFDHLNGLIRRYAEAGNRLDSVAMQYLDLPDRQRLLVVDEVRHEAYVSFERHGYSQIRRLDLSSGSLGDPVDIPLQFPYKILVQDRVAYFMYREGPSDDVKRLYRMRL